MAQGTFIEAQITNMEIIRHAHMEGRWYTGRKIRQIGQNGLCMLSSISKTVQGKIFILMILHAQIAHLLKSTIEMSCTIILLRSSLQ